MADRINTKSPNSNHYRHGASGHFVLYIYICLVGQKLVGTDEMCK